MVSKAILNDNETIALPTEKFCQKIASFYSCHIIVQLGRITQQSRKSCYRRQGQLFSAFPSSTDFNQEVLILLFETQDEWPNNPTLRLNLNPLDFFKCQNLSKKSLWTFLGEIKFLIITLVINIFS